MLKKKRKKEASGKAVDFVINSGKLVFLWHFDSERSRYVSQAFGARISQSSQEDEADASGFSPFLILCLLSFSCSPFLPSLPLHFLPPSPIRLPRWFSSKESTCQCRRRRFNPWVGKIPGEGNGNPLQYSCLKNPMDRGAWRAAVHGLQRVGHDESPI